MKTLRPPHLPVAAKSRSGDGEVCTGGAALFDCEQSAALEQPFGSARLLAGAAARYARDAPTALVVARSHQPTLDDDLFEVSGELLAPATVDAAAGVDQVKGPSARVVALQTFNRSVGAAYSLAKALGEEAPGFKKKALRDPQLLQVLLGLRKEASLSCASEKDWRELHIAVERARHLLSLPLDLELSASGHVTLRLSEEPSQLAPSGLDAVAQAFRSKPVPYARWEGEVKQLSVLTCNRPIELKRCLEGYLENLRLHHREGLPITVWDDSIPALAQENRDLVRTLQARGFAVRYVGPKEKEKLRARLERGLPRKLGKTAAEVRADLDELLGVRAEDGSWQGSAGKQRQWIATFTAGTRSLVVDDDTLPCVADSSPKELARAARFAGRHLARLSTGLQEAQLIPGKELISPYLRSDEVPVPLHYDIVGAAEAENPNDLVGAGFTFHRDVGAMQVVEGFVNGGRESAGALQGRLATTSVANRDGHLQFSGSAYVTPLNIDFAGLNLSSGRNEDWALGAFYSALTPHENRRSNRFLHFHQRGERHSNQAKAYFEECVNDSAQKWVANHLAASPELASQPSQLSAQSLAVLPFVHEFVDHPERVSHLIWRVKEALKLLNRRLGALEKVDTSSLQIGQLPPSLVPLIYPLPAAGQDPLWHAFRAFSESFELLNGPQAATWEAAEFLQRIAAAEAQLNWHAPVADLAELQRMQSQDPASLIRHLTELRQGMVQEARVKERYSSSDLDRMERNVFLSDRQLWQLARMPSFYDQEEGYEQDLEVLAQHYLQPRQDPRERTFHEEAALSAALVAQQVLQERREKAGEPPLDLAEHLTFLRSELTELKKDLEQQYLCDAPDTQTQTQALRALMEREIRTQVCRTLKALPYPYALQERLHLASDVLP